MSSKCTIIIFLCIWSISVKLIFATFISNKFEKEIISLLKVLEYTSKRPQEMNLDTILGITFAEANIKAALQHKNVIFLNTYQKHFLLIALKLFKNIRETIYTYKAPTNQALSMFKFQINRPEIWIKPIDWRKINAERRANSDLTLEKIVNSMFAGHPQEYESDYCLINLMRDCQFIDKCQDLILHNENTTTGYPLTHKLFLIQVMDALKCNTTITKFHPYLSLKFCSLILQDIINLEAMNFPFTSKDLALEQVFLCGMEGYLNFLSDHYVQLILDWQHSSGCYTDFRYNENWEKNRIHRAANFTDFGCLNHTTGLGIAILALMIRKDIEMFNKLYM